MASATPGVSKSATSVFIRVFTDSRKGWMAKQTPAPSSSFTHESAFAR